LYYIRSRQAGTVLHYSLCRVLPNEEAVVEILLNRSVETGPAAGSISRIQKLVPAGPDEIALVWETLYREASEEESLVRISHLEYVNLKEKTARTAELRPAMFTTPADLRHEKVAAVFPSWKKPGVFIETVQAGEKKMGRAFFFLNAENGALEAVRLPVDNWSAVLGVDEDDQVFLLEQVVPRDDKIRALFRVHDRRQDKDRFFAIQSDPAESFMGNFFFASSGRIFSYLLSSDGIQIVSWK
jgi:hypothetical protein